LQQTFFDRTYTTGKKQRNSLLCHLLGDLGVTYVVHLWLVGKRVADFLLVLIELFSPALTVEALWAAAIDWNCDVRKGDGWMGHFEHTFQRKRVDDRQRASTVNFPLPQLATSALFWALVKICEWTDT